MPNERKIIKIFLASPGDLQAERRLANRIVEEENRNHAIRRGYQIDLVGWEETVSQYGRPQAVINRELEQCEYFVGMIWRRWGTPPGDNSHPYSSGFEEEYELSRKRRRETGNPGMSLLFKSPPESQIGDPGDELKKVLAFRQRVIDKREILFKEFNELDDFNHCFRSIVSQCLEDRIEKDAGGVEGGAKDHTQDERSESNGEVKAANDAIKPLFEKTASDFMVNLVSRSNAKETVVAEDIARLRLLSLTVERAFNDNALIGVHDANLLYFSANKIQFTEPEIRVLRSTALEKLEHQSVPLWRWLYYDGRDPIRELTADCIFGKPKQRKGAIDCLRLSEFDFYQVSDWLDRDEIIRINLSDDSDPTAQIAMLSYLKIKGEEADFNLIDGLIDDKNANVSKSAVEARAAILAKSNKDEALKFIAMRADVKISENILEKIFSRPDDLRTDTLKSCLKSEDNTLVECAADLLRKRNSLSFAESDDLCQSDSVNVRKIGVEAKLQGDPSLTLDSVKQDLVGSPSRGLAFFLNPFESNREGQKAFRDLELKVVSKIPFDELSRLANGERDLDGKFQIGLYQGYYKDKKEEIVSDLFDGFREFFQYEKRRRGEGRDNDKIEYYRRRMVEDTLDLVCREYDSGDLEVVRYVLDNDEIEIKRSFVEFMGKHDKLGDIRQCGA